MKERILIEMPIRNLSTLNKRKIKPPILNRIIHLMDKDWSKAIKGIPAERR